MKREYSLEEKLAFISLVEQGQSARSVSDRFHLGHHILFEWLAAYKDIGIDGLKPREKRPRRLSYEEKCRIIREYQESELTLFQLSAKYKVSSSQLGNWVRLAENEGFEALIPKKQGRQKTGMASGIRGRFSDPFLFAVKDAVDDSIWDSGESGELAEAGSLFETGKYYLSA